MHCKTLRLPKSLLSMLLLSLSWGSSLDETSQQFLPLWLWVGFDFCVLLGLQWFVLSALLLFPWGGKPTWQHQITAELGQPPSQFQEYHPSSINVSSGWWPLLCCLPAMAKVVEMDLFFTVVAAIPLVADFAMSLAVVSWDVREFCLWVHPVPCYS